MKLIKHRLCLISFFPGHRNDSCEPRSGKMLVASQSIHGRENQWMHVHWSPSIPLLDNCHACPRITRRSEKPEIQSGESQVGVRGATAACVPKLTVGLTELNTVPAATAAGIVFKITRYQTLFINGTGGQVVNQCLEPVSETKQYAYFPKIIHTQPLPNSPVVYYSLNCYFLCISASL